MRVEGVRNGIAFKLSSSDHSRLTEIAAERLAGKDRAAVGAADGYSHH
jgi:hypothetical protein